MEKVRILGFDPGTANTGYALLQGDIPSKVVELTNHFGVLRTKKEDGDIRSRIDQLGSDMKKLIAQLQPAHVVIEDFVEQGKLVGKTYKEMAFLIEHMRLAGREMGYEVTIYENGEWKKIAIGAYRLNKEQVKHFVAHNVKNAKEFLGSRTATHVWDSVGIAYAKYKQLQGELR